MEKVVDERLLENTHTQKYFRWAKVLNHLVESFLKYPSLMPVYLDFKIYTRYIVVQVRVGTGPEKMSAYLLAVAQLLLRIKGSIKFYGRIKGLCGLFTLRFVRLYFNMAKFFLNLTQKYQVQAR